MLTLSIPNSLILIRFILNDKNIETNQPPGMVLLDFIRYHRHLMGTKIGCREGDCGACTVLVGELKNGTVVYQSMTSCLLPLGNVQGKHIVTIEGINFPDHLNPIQQAMAEQGATQCGFCTPGFVVSLAGFCLSDERATQENAIAAVDGNICRCTGYKSIERAAGKVADLMKEKNGEQATSFVANKKILPEYFASIKIKLQNVENGVLPTSHPPNPTCLVGGGTDLYVQKHEELVHADNQFLFDHTQLKGIYKEGNRCTIGASATVTDLLHSSIIQQAFPDFPKYAKLVSSTPIRNMATIAGNFINASPIGDFTIFFLALDSQVDLSQTSGLIRPDVTGTPSPKEKGKGNDHLFEESGFRTVPLRKLYKGYKQLDKQPDEIISKIRFELPGKNSYFNFEKVSKRTNLDIASVNSAIHLIIKNNRIENAGLSAGGVGPVPMYLQKTSEFLTGKTITAYLVDEAIDIMQKEISPISDARGSKEYKTLLLGQLIRAHLRPLLNPPPKGGLVSPQT
ncbi:FAD binding domain-containing protein [Terrimonas pollutisoli]|uniref:FAD binding domain-containing protein n=1 Tax=Terrimonas pollutisoli TaxID=3034147 RepID=UPI0023EDB9B0|nr:FAD binding domain-containing protein [Terrimonas sp. H1YJ31]